MDRSSFQYERSRGDDAAVRARLRDLANERRRFGHRRVHVPLRRDGWAVNPPLLLTFIPSFPMVVVQAEIVVS